MLNLRLLRHPAATEELREARGKTLLLIVRVRSITLLALAGDCDIYDSRGDARSNRLHGLIERCKSGDAVIVERGRAEGGSVYTSISNKDYGSQGEASGKGSGNSKLFSSCY
jgi:hypothetical protein